MEENREATTRSDAQGIPSTQDIQARYPTPPSETPGSKRKRNNRKRQAVSRMRQKRRLNSGVDAVDDSAIAYASQVPQVVPQVLEVVPDPAVNNNHNQVDQVGSEANAGRSRRRLEMEMNAAIQEDTVEGEGGTEEIQARVGRMHIGQESKSDDMSDEAFARYQARFQWEASDGQHVQEESDVQDVHQPPEPLFSPSPEPLFSPLQQPPETLFSPLFIARYATPLDETGSQRKKRQNRKRKAISRRRLPVEERLAAQSHDRVWQAARRSRMAHEESVAVREYDQQWRASQRSQLDESVRAEIQQHNTQQHAVQRSQMEDDERQDVLTRRREQARIRRELMQIVQGVALLHYDVLIEVDVTGANIEGGRHQLDKMTDPCRFCQAVKWSGETANSCCRDGDVVLAAVNEPPEVLRVLFNKPDFMRLIRAYNSIFAFTSLGASIAENPAFDGELANGRDGVYTLRLQGAMIHRIGSLCPREGQEKFPKFAQIYFFDSDMERQVAIRSDIMTSLHKDTLRSIQTMMNDINPFAQQFINAGQEARMHGEGVAEHVSLRIHETNNVDLRTHNRPTADEVAAIIVSTEEPTRGRDLILHQKSGSLLRIFEWWGSYDPLQYPLLFPYGELGWSDSIAFREGSQRRGRVSALMFAAYRLYPKHLQYSLLHRAGRLFQQWCVDQYAKVEQQRLKFQENNQLKLRGDIFNGVMDMMTGDEQLRGFGDIGKKMVLSSSFTAGPRDMREKYHQAMTIVREVSNPHLFITITTNPRWKEIQDELRPGESAQDRPDLVARVFKLKFDKLMKMLTKDMVLGRVVAYIHVIEFQKRGLPHAHILIMLHRDDVPKTPEEFDNFVSAEIPDKRTHPLLFQTVTSSMIHGPCGPRFADAPCMKDGKCQKRYPRPFTAQTTADKEGYPLYQRRNIRTAHNRVFKNGQPMGNEWVIPYNPYLSLVMNCHINVEICSTITAVKYLFKYVYKGSDRAVVTIGEERDEIKEYLNARYISASESCWRLFTYPLTSRSHSVIPLPVHLHNKQWITVKVGDRWEDIVEDKKKTQLTQFFKLCSTDPLAVELLYQDVPKHYTWQKKNLEWQRRKKGGDKALGRVINCPPSDIERFHLRMMLCYRRGPKSFKALRTVDGRVYQTFHDAAYAAGYLLDDSEYVKAMQEAAQYAMPYQLRKLFATIIAHCSVSRVRDLFDQFTEEMTADFTHEYGGDRITAYDTRRAMFNSLKDVDKQLRSISTKLSSLTEFPSLPQLAEYSDAAEGLFNPNENMILASERYETDQLEKTTDLLHLLNEQQRSVYDEVVESVDNPSASSKLFYLDGPGGTGKTFLIEQILARLRTDKKIALAVATSGIAALLLTGGRTAHSRFKVPIDNLDGTSTCNVTKQTHLAELFTETSFIVFDEAPMAHRHVIECIDRTLRDIRPQSDKPFGGVTVLFAGDFRQTLPIIPRGTIAEVISACLTKSPLWRECKLLTLTVNERLRQQERNGAPPDEVEATKRHAEFILSVGEGSHPIHDDLGPGFVKIPNHMLLQTDGTENDQQPVRKLIEHVYGDVNSHGETNAYFANRAILAPKNVNVHLLNLEVLSKLEGEEQIYRSMDTVHDDDDQTLYPTEYLNSLQYSGLPLHEMKMKVGAPIMLMRNLNLQGGLCNGTRLQITMMTDNCICAKILTGPSKGEDVLIPRVTIEYTNVHLPFMLRRRQFPVQLAFAMTINKAQGQSLQHIGLFLPEPVFGHGQLYVALSRSTSKNGLKVLVLNPALVEPDGVWTDNVVYRQVIRS